MRVKIFWIGFSLIILTAFIALLLNPATVQVAVAVLLTFLLAGIGGFLIFLLTTFYEYLKEKDRKDRY